MNGKFSYITARFNAQVELHCVRWVVDYVLAYIHYVMSLKSLKMLGDVQPAFCDNMPSDEKECLALLSNKLICKLDRRKLT